MQPLPSTSTSTPMWIETTLGPPHQKSQPALSAAHLVQIEKTTHPVSATPIISKFEKPFLNHLQPYLDPTSSFSKEPTPFPPIVSHSTPMGTNDSSKNAPVSSTVNIESHSFTDMESSPSLTKSTLTSHLSLPVNLNHHPSPQPFFYTSCSSCPS